MHNQVQKQRRALCYIQVLCPWLYWQSERIAGMLQHGIPHCVRLLPTWVTIYSNLWMVLRPGSRSLHFMYIDDIDSARPDANSPIIMKILARTGAPHRLTGSGCAYRCRHLRYEALPSIYGQLRALNNRWHRPHACSEHVCSPIQSISVNNPGAVAQRYHLIVTVAIALAALFACAGIAFMIWWLAQRPALEIEVDERGITIISRVSLTGVSMSVDGRLQPVPESIGPGITAIPWRVGMNVTQTLRESDVHNIMLSGRIGHDIMEVHWNRSVSEQFVADSTTIMYRPR